MTKRSASSPKKPHSSSFSEEKEEEIRNRSNSMVNEKPFGMPPRYYRLLEEANAPVFGICKKSCVTMWNKKVEAITGFDAEYAIGKPLKELIGASKRAAVERAISKALYEGESELEMNIPLKTSTGRNALIMTNLTPHIDEDGQVHGVFCIGQDVTERRIHEKQYARVIMQANAPIIELDKDANISVWNAKAASITGYASSDAIGAPLLNMVDEDFRSIVSDAIDHTLRTGIAGADFELPLKTANGARVEIVLCLTPRFDASGFVVGVVAIGQDVTERNAKEMEYRKFIDSANAPIFGVDTEGRVVIFNSKAAETSEYVTEEIMGESLVEKLISEEYRDAVSSVFERAYQGLETSNFEFPLVTKSGRKVEILLNATPRYDHMGKLVGVIAIGQDITERIIQEQEYSRLIDTANAPIFGVDREFKVIIWNKKAATITQYTNADTMGEELLKFISVEYRKAVGDVLAKALDGEETANFEFPLITKSGRRLDILLNATPKFDHFGNICGVVGIGQDITDRRAQEQEYTRLIDTANAPIFGVDKNGLVNIWNRKAAQITEYSVIDVLGANLVEEFIPQEYKQEVGGVLSRALEGIETANFEFPLNTRTGRRVEILLNATPRYDEKGAIIGVVGIGQDITVRIAQEQEYSRLIDTANAPIFGIDMSGCVNIWNKKAAEITQYSTEEVIGKDLVETFISADSRAAVGSALKKALKGELTANFDFPMITQIGRRVEILLNATPRYNELGKIVGVVGIGQDITERIAQEQEYTRLIDTANAPIFGVDEEGKVNIWNKKAAEITQYTPSDVMGEKLVEKFISEDYREAVGYVLSKALNGTETANFEFPLITKNGRRVEILLNATPRFNEHGQVMGMVGIGQDITDRIAQEQEYSRLIDKANAPIFGVDVDCRVNIWNKKAAEITQYTPEEVLGENLVDKFISENYKSAVASVLAKALVGDEAANFEVPLITKTGRKVNILLNATARFDQLGHIVGVVAIGQDITDRIAQEQEYTRLIDTANAPIFGVDEEGRVNIWNKKAAEITGYTPSDVMGENLVEKFISEDYREAVGYVLSKALNGTETANFEFPLITKTGRRVEILLNATSRFNEHGKVMGMVGIGQDITDRIAQEQEYTRLIDTANAPIFGVDADGRVNIWNRKAADITQYTNEDVLGEDLVEKFISEEYRAPVRSVLEKAFEGVETANFEFPLITKSGRRLEILLNATPKFDQQGKIVGVVGIGQDITDRIAQEQEYSRLIDTANAPIFGVDANMCVNIWNKKAAQITNYSIGEVMGENLVETFISPEYRPIVAEVLSKALQGIQTANFEFPLITRPGTRIEILLNATPRFDQHGHIVGVVGIGQDITDRIAQEHEYFRLIDTANAPIFGVDTNGCINEWNQKIEEITGYHKSQVLGLSLVHTFIIPESRQQVRQLLNQALIGIDVGEMELPMTTKKGCFLLLLVNASSKKDMHGNIRGVIGVGQDYTARKQMEAAKVNFLASFSHELRTPLNGVLGMLELLKEQSLDKVPERYVHMAYVSGSLLLNLINDILDLSKIEAGHLEISAAPFQMQDLLDYSIEIFKFKARERGLKLLLECDSLVPHVVVGDVVRLRQVLLNLLSNAIKFTNTGSITVSCSVVHAPDLPKSFKKLLFQVIDTGIGMDEQEKSRLFSLFTKLERTRQNNPTGSGLGLAICKQLVELMDGHIDVDSELGVGSNFFFTVVVRLLDENIEGKNALLIYSPEELAAAAAVVSGGSNVTSGGTGVAAAGIVGSADGNIMTVIPNQARILVVEDNEFNWEVVKCFLHEDDHLLQWEVNGRAAVQAYKEHHDQFDLIFMDCEMPVMDGYTATSTIRQYEKDNQLPRIPILGLTAYAMSGDRQKCLEAGMDEFMVKPISKTSLRKAIRQWMRIRYLGRKPANDPSNLFSATTAAAVNSSSTGGADIKLTATSKPSSPVRIPSTSTTGESKTLSAAALARLSDKTQQQHNGEQFSTPDIDSSTKLAPASKHMEQLDLARAISNLELDDPMAIGRNGGRAFRTSPPSASSIFSVGSYGAPGSLLSESNRLDASSSMNSSAQEFKYPYSRTMRQSLFQMGGTTTTFDATQYAKTNPTQWSHPLPAHLLEENKAKRKVSKRKSFEYEDANLSGVVRGSNLQVGLIPNISSHAPTAGAGNSARRRSSTTRSSRSASVNDIPSSGGSDQSSVSSGNIVTPSTQQLDVVIPEGDPVNYALGVEQCGGREELFLNLLEKFALGCEKIVERIDSAYVNGNYEIMRREAHSLKGSSAYVAALRVSKSAFRVQLACERILENRKQPKNRQVIMVVAEEQELLTNTGLSPRMSGDDMIVKPKFQEDEMDESLKLALQETHTRLKKEYKLLKGYLKRNFVFRSMQTKDHQHHHHRSDKQNACIVM